MTTTNPINREKFDTRDLIEYKDVLEDDLKDIFRELYQIKEIEEEANMNVMRQDADYLTSDQYETLKEYEKIQSFCEELADSPGFEHGETVIHEDYFEEYVEELLKNGDYLPDNLPSFICIDWEQTAKNVVQDFMEVEYEGETYYIIEYQL